MSASSRSVRRLAAVVGALGLGACVAPYSLPVDTDRGTDTEPAATDSDGAAEEEERTSCEEDDDLAWCDGTCVDLGFDSEHCGACEFPCLLGTSCIDGECVGSCSAGCEDAFHICDEGVCRCRDGLLNCNGLCVNPLSDPGHCGGCWEECPEGLPFCGDEECQLDCDEFPSACEGECTDTAFDPLNCGACGRSCDSDELCLDGECVLYERLDEVACPSCPCPADCPLLCCPLELFEVNVCVDAVECPEL